MAEIDIRAVHRAPGDSLFDDASDAGQDDAAPVNPMDSDKAHELHRRLMTWLYEERDLQSDNRLEMAIDADMYDGVQWRPEDEREVIDRGQMPLVFNEVAPMIDWMIGTERRARVDAKVLGRTDDDVQAADVKTKVMKYMSDVNRSVYVRSKAFGEAVKAGLSWIEDGVRDDPTKERVYKRMESWRNVLHDSRGTKEDDLSGTRYLFRWRDIDLDVARAMFPDRAQLLEDAASDFADIHADDEALVGWGAPLTAYLNQASGAVRRIGVGSMLADGAARSRRTVRIYECQYREPVRMQFITSGPFRGAAVSGYDPIASAAAQALGVEIVDKVAMRMHIALFVPAGMIAASPAPWRHNDFSLTPVWCYRRGRDGMPYGMIRRVRDLQLDLNKRASKANFLINTNQIIAERGTTEDWDTLRYEANHPNGVMVIEPNKRFELHRDTEQVAGQVQMMSLAADSIQKAGGVAQENLGRQTNAVSGEAIKARQIQGSVVTTEPFDNLRFATQLSGSKELSLLEQFMTEERVIRLTEERSVNWLSVNQIAIGPDGQPQILNDITASMADFVVSEQDYAGTLRQVMFDSMNQLAQRVPPEVSLRLMTMAFEFSDLPNKDQIAAQFRRITGDPDPDKQLSPEEQQQAQQKAQQQAEALQMQREDALLALQERQAKVREINAQAAKFEADAASEGKFADAAQQEAFKARAAAQDQIDKLSSQLAEATAEVWRLRTRADTDVAIARIHADGQARKHEATAAADQALQRIHDRLSQVEQMQQAASQPPAAPSVPAPATDSTAAPATPDAADTTPAPAPETLGAQEEAPVNPQENPNE